MARKVIQVCESNAGVQHDVDWNVTALCDDGTLWWLNNVNGPWNSLPDVPQEIVKANPEQPTTGPAQH